MASSTSRPSTRDVIKALKDLSIEKTRHLALHLGVPSNALDDIKDEFSGDTRKEKYVEKWLAVDAEASWEKLVSGLREIGMTVLAGKVESEHKTMEAPPPTFYTYTIPTAVLASIPQLQQQISALSLSEAAPLPAVASTAAALALANSHFPTFYTYTISTAVLASIPQLQQQISALSRSEAAPLPAVASTAAALALANSHFPTVSEARVEEVRASIECFEDRFTDLTVDVELDLVEKEDQDRLFFKRFQSYLLALPAAKKGVHVKFFRNSANDIHKSKEVQKLFHILKCYCDYSNYEIIVVVAKKFCTTPVQQRMLTYRDSHVEFEKNTTVNVYLCAISTPPESKIFIGYTKMSMKINKPSNICTLYDIRQLKESIARNASLHSHSMYIEVPEEGSVRVVLRFPEECGWSVAGVMTAEFIETHQLTDVTFDGEDLKSYLVSHSVVSMVPRPFQYISGCRSPKRRVWANTQP